jgi:hypothetical protein
MFERGFHSSNAKIEITLFELLSDLQLNSIFLFNILRKKKGFLLSLRA